MVSSSSPVHTARQFGQAVLEKAQHIPGGTPTPFDSDSAQGAIAAGTVP